MLIIIINTSVRRTHIAVKVLHKIIYHLLLSHLVEVRQTGYQAMLSGIIDFGWKGKPDVGETRCSEAQAT